MTNLNNNGGPDFRFCDAEGVCATHGCQLVTVPVSDRIGRWLRDEEVCVQCEDELAELFKMEFPELCSDDGDQQ